MDCPRCGAPMEEADDTFGIACLECGYVICPNCQKHFPNLESTERVETITGMDSYCACGRQIYSADLYQF